MTKRKLRKNADISPPQSPHDGIHTCSKGCKKQGCNRTLRDTIEEQNQQIETLKRDVLEKAVELRNLKEVVSDLRISAEDDLDSIEAARIENARLKAEVEELKSQPDPLTAYLYADTLRRDDIKTLKAHIERLTKAGDAMLLALNKRDDFFDNSDKVKGISDWLAAKEGKQS
jgi:predicted RNase H-like nuclease (RuvC/YqgF family)